MNKKIIFIVVSLFLMILLVSAQKIDEIGLKVSSPIYHNETKLVAVYRDSPIEISYSCYDGVSKNVTCSGWSTEKVFDHYETQLVKSVVIGYSKQGKTITGIINEDKDVISKWRYPIGDRNLIEYGRCRQYEKEKGVCDEY